MSVFPVFMEMEDETCLIVGGGRVAYRKAHALCQTGARVHVISKTFDERFVGLKKDGVQCYEVNDGVEAVKDWLECENIALLICATDDAEINHRLACLGKMNHIPVNSATNPKDCTFYFPSLVRRGDLTIGVSTGGKVPALSRMAAEQIGQMFPDWYGKLTKVSGQAREKMKGLSFSFEERKNILESILKTGIKYEGNIDEATVDQMIQKNQAVEKNDH